MSKKLSFVRRAGVVVVGSMLGPIHFNSLMLLRGVEKLEGSLVSKLDPSKDLATVIGERRAYSKSVSDKLLSTRKSIGCMVSKVFSRKVKDVRDFNGNIVPR